MPVKAHMRRGFRPKRSIRYIPRRVARKLITPIIMIAHAARFCFAASERPLGSATLRERQTRGGESQHDFKGDRHCSHQEAFRAEKFKGRPVHEGRPPELQLKLLRKMSVEGHIGSEYNVVENVGAPEEAPKT